MRRLVVELARVHGVLDLDLGPDGDRLLTVSGRGVGDPAGVAAHARVVTRVTRMWRAGDPAG